VAEKIEFIRLLKLEVAGISEVYGWSSSTTSYSTLCLGPSGFLMLRWWSVVMKFRSLKAWYVWCTERLQTYCLNTHRTPWHLLPLTSTVFCISSFNFLNSSKNWLIVWKRTECVTTLFRKRDLISSKYNLYIL